MKDAQVQSLLWPQEGCACLGKWLQIPQMLGSNELFSPQGHYKGERK